MAYTDMYNIVNIAERLIERLVLVKSVTGGKTAVTSHLEGRDNEKMYEPETSSGRGRGTA